MKRIPISFMPLAVGVAASLLCLAGIAIINRESARVAASKPSIESDTFKKAIAASVERNRLVAAGELIGLNCWMSAFCEEMIGRAKKNPRLKTAFLTAKAARVSIVPDWKFSVGNGIVDIDVTCSDDEIIKFLTK